MRFDVTILRVVFAAFLISAGYVLHPIPGHRLFSAGGAAITQVPTLLFLMLLRRASFETLVGAAARAIFGHTLPGLIGARVACQDATAGAPGSQRVLGH